MSCRLHRCPDVGKAGRDAQIDSVRAPHSSWESNQTLRRESSRQEITFCLIVNLERNNAKRPHWGALQLQCVSFIDVHIGETDRAWPPPLNGSTNLCVQLDAAGLHGFEI